MYKDFLWHAAWVQGRRPKDITPAVFAITRKKNRKVKETIADQTWINDINLHAVLTVVHLQQIC